MSDPTAEVLTPGALLARRPAAGVALTDHEVSEGTSPRPARATPENTKRASISRWGNLGRSLQARAVSDVVHDAALRAHLRNVEGYSTHSLRAGGATETYRAGVPVTTICDHGRWKRGSPVVLGYIRAVDRWKDNAMLGVGL